MLPGNAARMVKWELIWIRNATSIECQAQQVPLVEPSETAGVQPVDEVLEGGRVMVRKRDGTVGFLEVTGKCCLEEVGSTADKALVDLEALLSRTDEHNHHGVVKESWYQSVMSEAGFTRIQKLTRFAHWRSHAS